MVDSVQFSFNAQHAMQSDQSITAEHAMHANHADTAQFVSQAESALTAISSQNSTNAIYADTANYVNVSHLTENIIVTKNDDANITLFSTEDGSSSYLTLVARKLDGEQTELRVVNEGGSSGLIIQDASNDNVLMAVGADGNVTATSFTGDGSRLTGISSVDSLSDLGVTATAEELNYVDGVTSSIQEQLDAKVGITQDQTDAITANTAKVGYTEDLVSANSAVAANTAKAGITSAQATIIENTSGVNTGDQDITGITTNTASISTETDRATTAEGANATNITTNTAAISTETDRATTAAGANATNITTNTTAIAVNTAKTGITDNQASAITANTAKVGYTEDLVSANSAVAANTAKAGITSTQATIIENTSGVNTGDQDITGITTNTASISTETDRATTAEGANATNITTNTTAIALNTAKTGISSGQAQLLQLTLQRQGSQIIRRVRLLRIPLKSVILKI